MGNLQKLIEEKKQELIKLVEKYDFTHKQVLYLSQDIDILINKFIYKKINVNEATVYIRVYEYLTHFFVLENKKFLDRG
ncbi:Spo0E family sporulation regulatory protein-aspartic acid phosphatase [Bacillus paramycoides]|uniref:Spo0E family sporulation regulatory protein-aspartic acid phosphatase n=1 Tax=Bacillus paramycoides TaxID=2026194 RepID=UPI003B967B8D